MSADVLNSWKKIATYVGRDVRTVQRWERETSFPVHRPRGEARGAVFAFRAEVDAWLRHAAIKPRNSPLAERSAAQASFKYRILIVDDDEPLLAETAAVLSREGYAVETARDGFEALAVMRGGQPEILIAELKMPNMSGFELLAVVRKRFPSIGVVARSGEFSPAGMPEGVLADRYVAKGDNSDFELVEIVRELLSESPVRAQPARPETAPAWLPRSERGYVVVTCLSCLRSFSVLRSQVQPGVVVRDKCIHCGDDVSYRVDSTVTKGGPPSASRSEESRARIEASRRRIAETRAMIDGAKRPPSDDSGHKTSR